MSEMRAIDRLAYTHFLSIRARLITHIVIEDDDAKRSRRGLQQIFHFWIVFGAHAIGVVKIAESRTM